MGEDAEQDLGLSGFVASTSQGWAESAFVLGDRAFDVPAMTICLSIEATPHLAAIRRLGPAIPGVAPIERNQCRADAQDVTGQAVVMFAVVGGVGQQAIDDQMSARLPGAGSKLRRIPAGPVAQRGPGPQIRCRLRGHGQLGPAAPDERTELLASNDKVIRDVVILEAGGVDADLGTRRDQAARVGNTEKGGKEGIESPFFRSRSWAYLRVE